MTVPSTISAVYSESTTWSLNIVGDEHEQRWYDRLIRPLLPAYEDFWRLFVFPFRAREDSVWIATNLAPHHEAICIYNYSILRSSTRVYEFREIARTNKTQQGDVGSDAFDDFVIWLTMSYDRFLHLAGALFIYWSSPSDIEKRSIKAWRQRADELDGLVGTDLFVRLDAAQNEVETYRHFIVHGLRFPGGLDRVPNADGVKNKHLLYWSEWARLAKMGASAWEANTVDRMALIDTFWEAYLRTSNHFWTTMVKWTLDQRGHLPFADHEKVFLPSRRVLTSPTGTSAVVPGPIFTIPSGTTYPPELDK